MCTFVLSLARPSSLSGKISQVVKALTTPKAEMKNDLVTDLSSLCGLRAWSKTNPKEASALGWARCSDQLRWTCGNQDTESLLPAFPSVQYFGALEDCPAKSHGSPWSNLQDCFFVLFYVFKGRKAWESKPFLKITSNSAQEPPT